MKIYKIFILLTLFIWANTAQSQNFKGLPENASAKVKKWAVVFDFDTDSCYPAPAVSNNGKKNGGLKTTGDRTGGCRDGGAQILNANTYCRTAKVKYNGVTYEVIMYALYFEKDQILPWSGGGDFGHRHDWEYASVWLRNDTPTHATYSAHTDDGETKSFNSVYRIGNHVKVVYHQHGGLTHAMRFAKRNERAENELGRWLTPKMLEWDRLTYQQRDVLSLSWGKANAPFVDRNFFKEIGKYLPGGYPSRAEWENQNTPLDGYYSCNDGGHYYIRQVGNDVYWFGEHPNGNWANVFKGRLSGNVITGYFHDVPKGRMTGRGELRLQVINEGKNIRKISGAFGGSLFTKTQKPHVLPVDKAAGYSQNGNIRDMDGLWTCDDGGKYYIREIGGNIVWFGEKVSFYASLGTVTSFANVAVGRRTGNTITVDWADVPKGRTTGNGKLTLRINHADEIIKVTGSNFKGKKWSREGGINGTWRNTDANTRGVTKFVVTNNGSTIQVYGSCYPRDCDWGKKTLQKSGSSYKAFYDPGFGTKSLTLTPQSNGQIEMIYTSTYRDSRPTKTYTYYFKK